MSLPSPPPEPRFLGSFPTADASLDPPLPEIAFVGRSNVGKSSLLNALVGRRIARVSGTPGKTCAMNVYEVTGWWGRGGGGRDGANVGSAADQSVPHPHIPTSPGFYFLDLPGYGYARASKSERAAHAKLLQHALRRPGLAGVVWLLDIRHDPSIADRAMQDLFAGAATRVLVAVTKGDKLPRGRRLARERALRATLALDDDQVVLTSARTGDGVAELREAIAGLADAER